MRMSDVSLVDNVDKNVVINLTEDDCDRLRLLYKQSYPDNWFDPHMLATGKYFGTIDGDKISAVAGIHVFSKKYRIAALGNITTHPLYRGKGLSTRVTAALCTNLLREIDHIGLNVSICNRTAINCYTKLGFEVHAEYDEYFVSRS